MKKFLCLTMVIAVLCMCFSGCSVREAERKVDEIEDKIENKTDKIEDKVEKKADKIEGEIEKKVEKFDDDGAWEAVEEQYDAIEVLAFIEAKDSYTVDEIKELVNRMDEKYQKVKDGITSDNETDAQELYRTSCTLDRMDDKHAGLSEHPITELGDEGKDIVENLYNTGSPEYKESKREFEDVLNKVKDYSDEDWKAVEGKL